MLQSEKRQRNLTYDELVQELSLSEASNISPQPSHLNLLGIKLKNKR